MASETLLHLKPSESVVAQMSATIFAGLVQRPELSSATEDQLLEKSAALAIKLAVRVEKLVKSDDEWLKSVPNTSPHG